jgi:hypothetical protein
MKKKLKVPPKTKSRGKKLLSQEGGFASRVKPLTKKEEKIENKIEDLLKKYWS